MQDLSMPYNLSYWELKSIFQSVDIVIVGSGIVGLNAALHFKQNNKYAKVLVLERGILPYGASTKNAGFACFGSISEIFSDIEKYGDKLVYDTIKMRIDGLRQLKKIVGSKNLCFEKSGGYELFFDEISLQKMADYIPTVNRIFEDILNKKNVCSITSKKINTFGFQSTSGLIFNKEEGAIDTGSMIHSLYKKCVANDIKIINNIHLNHYHDDSNLVSLNINEGFEFNTKKLIIASNGFAKKLLPSLDVIPARAQVLVTKPVNNLKVKGTFHFEEGYYYFRNVDNRILFGGARNLDFEKETTDEFGVTKKIQNNLMHYLQEVILPKTKFEIEHYWSGIMGVGKSKMPIIKNISKNVFCSVRMGGMGVAIGSLAGIAVSKLAND